MQSLVAENVTPFRFRISAGKLWRFDGLSGTGLLNTIRSGAATTETRWQR